MFKPSVYLAIDPGMTSGWATLDEDGIVIEFGQFKYGEATNALRKLLHEGLKACITEDYKNYGHMQQKRWSRNETSKLIGKIEAMCEMHNVPVVLQMAHVKMIGYKWAGLDKAPSNHAISHQYDAIAHGVYWTQQNGIRKPGLAITKDKNNG